MTAITAPRNTPAPQSAGRGGSPVGPRLAIGLLALLVAAPIAAVAASLAGGSSQALAHVLAGPGRDYLAGSLTLCLLVGAGAALIGALGGALVALTDFPGRRFLSVALALPLAVPAYISAYAYADFLSPLGPFARALGGTVPIHHLPGAAFVLALSVYPYVYLAVRASLAARSAALLEAARMLGATPAGALGRVLAPAGRAAFAGGLALALMETAADFGVADFFGVQTLSTGILRTWRGLGDLAAASQLATGLFLLALLFVALEEAGRRRGADDARGGRPGRRLPLRGAGALAAFAFCLTPPLLGFALPTAVLIASSAHGAAGSGRDLAAALANTALIGLAGAAITITLALALALAARRAHGRLAAFALRTATLGYALPGAVIAIGVLGTIEAAPGVTLVGAGLAALLYAYAVRFLTAGYNAAAGGLAQVHPQTDAAARTLGAGPARIAASIHAPLAAGAVGAGSLIVFIDIARELPATLLLRPFGFETAATRVYRLASDERLADAAAPALFLIALGALAVAALEAAQARAAKA